MIKALDVFLAQRLIGQIISLPGESTFFSFEEGYLHAPHRPMLSQSLISKTGALIAQTKPTRLRLPPFFSNLLPEGHLREYLAAKHHVRPAQEFSLIEALGSDLPGAVVIQPSTDRSPKDRLKPPQEKTVKDKPPYRFSLAGIQLKFSALAEKQGGLTIPASGVGGTWIVKLPSVNFSQVPENEYAIMMLAKKIGIHVPECNLVALGDVAGLPELGPLQGQFALAVKRFDRGSDHKRIHMEDFAQVYGLYPEQKYTHVSYTNMAHMIWTLCGEKGLTEYIRRLVFNILIGNGDMHLKNWSFIYPDGETPFLSPAYDLLSTIPYIPSDQLALTLVHTKEMHRCTKDVFTALAEKAKLPKHLVLTTMKETVEATRSQWHQSKKTFNLDQKIIVAIDAHLQSIPL